ncbi:MAG: tRNA preQ1(34) S-adenosylmethionine ribosyltransferase-isomerase QueA [Woeseiaceae bacterium]|nr:tRNA preQ1(34) S-adenosylmethionine ribosyltransferase-isomerase QueA [Woeseiaceae bacterium]
MRIDDFDYHLPDSLIAKFPPAERRDSRLLDLGDGIVDRHFFDLPKVLNPGDLLVFNDTRVIPARLYGRKATGGRIELLVERIEEENTALAHIRASKSPKPGSMLEFDHGLSATVDGRQGSLYALTFSESLLPFLDKHGEVPLPPYLEREADESDRDRYQTVYANDPGAVAAPTAGLHFDEALMQETLDAGIEHAYVTLHVGAGTFQSLRHEDIEANRLHSERVVVSEECADAVRRTRERGGRVVAIGTTAVRSLEAASASGTIAPYSDETELFIMPGYDFKSVDAMVTNFHLPKSSLLMLVSAFAGRERILAGYRHAVEEAYRFFSYGDAMFLTRGDDR